MLAHRQIEAAERKARTETERVSVEVQTALIAGGLTSDEARAFLAGMPTAEMMMPELEVASVRALLADSRATS